VSKLREEVRVETNVDAAAAAIAEAVVAAAKAKKEKSSPMVKKERKPLVLMIPDEESTTGLVRIELAPLVAPKLKTQQQKRRNSMDKENFMLHQQEEEEASPKEKRRGISFADEKIDAQKPIVGHANVKKLVVGEKGFESGRQKASKANDAVPLRERKNEAAVSVPKGGGNSIQQKVAQAKAAYQGSSSAQKPERSLNARIQQKNNLLSLSGGGGKQQQQQQTQEQRAQKMYKSMGKRKVEPHLQKQDDIFCAIPSPRSTKPKRLLSPLIHASGKQQNKFEEEYEEAVAEEDNNPMSSHILSSEDKALNLSGRGHGVGVVPIVSFWGGELVANATEDDILVLDNDITSDVDGEDGEDDEHETIESYVWATSDMPPKAEKEDLFPFSPPKTPSSRALYDRMMLLSRGTPTLNSAPSSAVGRVRSRAGERPKSDNKMELLSHGDRGSKRRTGTPMAILSALDIDEEEELAAYADLD